MKKILLTLFILIFINLNIFSQKEVLQIFDGKNYNPIPWEEIESFNYEEEKNLLHITNDKDDIEIEVDEKIILPSAISIPLIEIFTDEYLEEIPNKIDYKSGKFLLSGFGLWEDIDVQVDIRGRGNSSWGFRKKPYRLKFDKKVSLCGLPKAKNYVLLANYTDCSLVQNALAFYIGELLDLPYTPKGIPVDVKLNGIYKGSYLLTNKPGINAGSVDIDESSSIMWELDIAFDEEYKFTSPLLKLPVMAVDPDMDPEKFEYWKNDFIQMERAAVAYKATEFVDLNVLARYILCYEIMGCGEVGFPKSVKLYKTEGGKYIFGPIWDFDTAMGKVWLGESYTIDKIYDPIWKNKLFQYLEDDPEYIEAIKDSWNMMKEKLPDLIMFIDEYSQGIYYSAIRNQTLWQGLDDFSISIIKMKEWLTLRFEALDKIYGDKD